MRYRESLVFIVCGYDEDPRELAEIPQVRAFFARLVQEWPHWLWFLARGVGVVGLFRGRLRKRTTKHGKQTGIALKL